MLKLGNLIPGAADAGEAIGTRGAANRLVQARQQLLDKLPGSEKTAAQTMLDHVDTYRAEANRLYTAARDDQSVVDDPAVRELLEHPVVKKAYEWGKANYQSRGNEIPTVTELASGAELQEGAGRALVRNRTEGGRLASLTRASDEELAGEYKALVDANAQANVAPTVTGAVPTDYGDGLHVGMKEAAVRAAGAKASRNKSIAKVVEELERRGIDPSDAYAQADATSFDFGANLPTVSHGGEVVRDVPNPEILALAKRGLGQIAQGFGGTSAVTREHAATALPLLDRLRAALHNASPAWKAADAYYAEAKNYERAFQKAFGAQLKTPAGALDPSKLKTPEAIAAWVESKSGTPIGAARSSGAQAGAVARLAEEIRRTPLTSSPSGLLASPLLQPTEAAAALRRPAFASDDAAREFTGLLSSLAQQSAKAAASEAPPATLHTPWRLLSPQNPLATPKGLGLLQTLSEDLSDPVRATALRASAKGAARGSAWSDLAKKLSAVGGGSAVFGRR